MLNLHTSYQVLGVAPNASAQDVRRAYLEQVKRWHPDRQLDQSSSNAASQDRFLQIQAAYDLIRQNQPRATEFSTHSFTYNPSRESRSASTLSKAEKLYDRAVHLARQGLYQKAIAELSAAIREDPYYSLAYKYRGYLKAYLGFEPEAKADFVKAHIVERRNLSWEAQEYGGFTALSEELEPESQAYVPRDYQSRTSSSRECLRSKLGTLLFLIVGLAIVILKTEAGKLQVGAESEQRSPEPFNYTVGY